MLAVWSFLGAGVTDYLLFIVSGFIFFTVALTLVLSRVGHVLNATQDAAANCDDDKPQSFREWAAKDFDTWQGRLSGGQAAILILLPIAAAALGMTAFGIAYHIAEHGM